MQDADLFLSLVGIAGVFVGFGALISVRSGGPARLVRRAGRRGRCGALVGPTHRRDRAERIRRRT